MSRALLRHLCTCGDEDLPELVRVSQRVRVRSPERRLASRQRLPRQRLRLAKPA